MRAQRKPIKRSTNGTNRAVVRDNVSVNTKANLVKDDQVAPPLSSMEPGPARLKRLRALAAQCPPPQEWYDEDFTGLTEEEAPKKA